MLKIEHISKSFNSLEALSDVGLDINRGEFFGLLGPNGAGKTTLMNIIIGYLKADKGQISIGDEIVITEDINFRKRFGYVPQEISLYQELTAYQNLKIFGSFFGLPKITLEQKIDEMLELVQLTPRKKDVVKEFSGGMKRRLNLAASILHDPEIILCDEPTVGVDPQSRNAIFEMLQELNKTGKTIIYTTHYMEEAERLCDRIAIIDNGKIIAIGTISELINILERKDTLKIQKNYDTTKKFEQLKLLGEINEFDYFYELIPGEKFIKTSALFLELEKLEIEDEYVEVSRASLEDVFLNLTGRSLRD
ncbi:MAG: ABC transporter ATP-binding protein [Melioribacteraceae bacterium]|nr:ABC transporter ATP-binding protein [Melioribacteraceae bacterium]MCF8354234.1 ABC transporter ATP-binding protein [Melioribacteraceae bacterium]MCF8394735.1 ABC transporter ATP-binding protein [Melioribacteraceae bacterium]MCF8417965.1 ABC transporter ATP-binding protein [Melioribacteraceae bacterium]